MIDLLFGVLTLFAFMMGNPHSQAIISEQLRLPTKETTQTQRIDRLLPLYPIYTEEKGWQYRTKSRRTYTAKQLKRAVAKSGETPVLIATRNVRVQEYINALLPLKRAGMNNVGITVISK